MTTNEKWTIGAIRRDGGIAKMVQSDSRDKAHSVYIRLVSLRRPFMVRGVWVNEDDTLVLFPEEVAE